MTSATIRIVLLPAILLTTTTDQRIGSQRLVLNLAVISVSSFISLHLYILITDK